MSFPIAKSPARLLRTGLAVLLLCLPLAACGKSKGPEGPKAHGIIITTATAEQRKVEDTESAVGWIEDPAASTLAAEVAGQVKRVAVHAGDHVKEGQLLVELDDTLIRQAADAARADVARLDALVRNQERQVVRLTAMKDEKFVSGALLDQNETDLAALKEQLASARSRQVQTEHDLAKAQVRAPFAGRVQERLVAVGDYLAVGKPLFQLSGEGGLRVHLPFPETVAARLAAHQTVRMTSPTAPGMQVSAPIAELKPMVDTANRALEAVVPVDAPKGWRAGASVNGDVVIAVRQGVVVPEVSVVRRPAGEVVYVIENGKARQQVVETGIRKDGWVEIRSGLAAGSKVAKDGAGFLTDGASVAAKE